MKLVLKPIALAILVATTQFSGPAYAQASNSSTTPVAQPAPPSTKAPIPTKAPEDWIFFDDATYTPVVDDVSRHLNAARKAFAARDNKKAAIEMRVVADELKLQAARLDKQNRALIKVDQALLATDRKMAQDSSKRINAGALKVSSAATAIESGTITTRAQLDKAIDTAARADMERRWLVTDVSTWYPVIEEPQRHFMDAVAAFARKDYRAAAADIRKATSYLRLEAGRATGEARHELDRWVTQLDALAASVDKGQLKDEQSMVRAFAKANHALALEYRSKAATSWARKQYDEAGYELMAAVHGLESAAGWAGEEARAGASATVAETRAMADKLASGGSWTRDEIAKGFDALGNSINALGQKIGSTRKASPFDVGA